MGCMCGCTTGLVRVLLFLSNFLFLLSGIAIAAVGIKVNENFRTFSSLFEGAYSATSLALIVVGSLVCVVAFCGCCGVIQRSVFLLQTYAVLLLCVFIAELAIGTVALTQVDDAAAFAEEHLDAFFTAEYETDGASELFDRVQRKFECCGVNGTQDFHTLGLAVAVSCCSNQTVLICTPANAYPVGCRESFADYVAWSLVVVGMVTLCVAAIEVFAVMFACCLAVRYNDKRRIV